MSGFHAISGHDIAMIADARGYTFEIFAPKDGDKGVSIYFSPSMSMVEKENIPLSFETRDAFIRDVQTQLGWKHTTTKISSYVSAIYFSSEHNIDEHTYQQLHSIDVIHDIMFRVDRWEIHWKEKDNEINSLRAIRRKHPEYFVGRRTPMSAMKSRLRPSCHVPKNGRVSIRDADLEKKKDNHD